MASTSEAAPGRPKRRICDRCDRPANTCLCTAVPPVPIALSGHIIVIRHPNEKKKPLATIPVLAKCLQNMTIVHSRKLHGDVNSKVDDLLAWAVSGSCPLYLLFPGPDAVPLDTVPLVLERAQQQQQQQQQEQQRGTGCALQADAAPGQSPAIAGGQAAAGPPAGEGNRQEAVPEGGRKPAYILIAVDGTWREAREMWKANSPQLLHPLGPGVQVSLPNAAGAGQQGADSLGSPGEAAGPGASSARQTEGEPGPAADEGVQGAPAHPAPAEPGAQQASVEEAGPCLIRKEPVDGYLTTYEALSQAVAILEGDAAMLQLLMEPLRMMTRYQAQHDPAVAARNKWARQQLQQGARQPAGGEAGPAPCLEDGAAQPAGQPGELPPP